MTGARMYVARSMDRPEMLEFPGGAVSVFTRPCPIPGRVNEDCAAVLPFGPDAGALVVADGMGGCPQGAAAARIAVEGMAAAVEGAARSGGGLHEAILEGFEEGNRAIVSMGTGAGTTVVAASVEGGMVRTYHCGDARALLAGGGGRIMLETVDHTPVAHEVQSGILTIEDAMQHHARHLVSNYMGTPAMKVEAGPPVQVRPRDSLVLASDGLFDNLRGDEVAALIQAKGPGGGVGGGGEAELEATTLRLLEAVLQRMGQGPGSAVASKPDDLTVILFRPLIPPRAGRCASGRAR